MKLERATTGDLATLHALVERAYRGETARGGWSHEADLLTGPRTSEVELQGLLDAGEHLLVWRDDGVIRACVRLVDLGDGLSYLGMLTVDPALQGEGLGKRLLAAAEGYAGEVLGARRMEMQVFSRRRELLSFYDRRGYKPTGERRPFPYGEWPDAGALYNDLEFVVLEKAL
ncbi:GNAT family N-acetyltransferase [Sphingomonas sp. LHG3406-1]|uniref:GNAT family N-acetyltransferase n=1 Tax=Sphingomonas sp. LHG3406-1 TaxID=2804617 RepID=UPI0026283C6E|nr:GNAT family N-acetyltransferase [Sphingomonas sp. LHG3406-1]